MNTRAPSPISIPSLAVVVVSLSALTPAWWWTLQEVHERGGNPLWMFSFSGLATIMAIAAVILTSKSRFGWAACTLVGTGLLAPTGFAYLGTLGCSLLVAAGLVVLGLRRRIRAY